MNPSSQVDQSKVLLEKILDVQEAFSRSPDLEEGFQLLLQAFLDLTESQYGFIGAVLTNRDGTAFLRTQAISNIAWDEETRTLFQEHAPHLEFQNLNNLFGHVIRTGEVVISNNPSQDPRRGWLPEGHPPLRAFLGIPFLAKDQVIGMVGVANRIEGYHENIISFLSPLVKFSTLSVSQNKCETKDEDDEDIKSKLKRSETQLQAVLDGSDSVIYIKDLENRYTLINKKLEEIFHISKPGIIGKTDHDIFPPAIADTFQQNDIRVLSSNKGMILEELAPHDDGLHTYVSNKFPLHDEHGEIYGICGISTDITAPKLTERALRESEERFRIMGNSVPVLIWMTDEHNSRTFVNQRWIDFTGCSGEKLLEHGWYNLVHPEDYDRCSRRYASAFFAHEPFTLEYRIRHVSGEYRWILDRGIPHYQDDIFLGFLGSCVDISERKALETSIRQYNQSLKEEVEEQTIRIQELEKRRMQVEKLAALSQVAAGVAHEINNPLASIKQSFHLVKKLLPEEHPRLKYVQKIDVEIDRIAEIIQKMYQLYQPSHVQPHLLDLGCVAQKAAELLLSIKKDHKIQVRWHLHPTLMQLPLPSTEIHQVLCNVIQNAFEAMEENGKIIVRTGMNSRCVWVQVSDDGPGIPKEVLPHIFDPFYSTKGPGPKSGMGLGLSVSKSLVEAMGGLLEVDTQEGKGSAFTLIFRLPLIPRYLTNPEKDHPEPARREDPSGAMKGDRVFS